MLKVDARVKEVRSNNDGTYRYVRFVNLDIGEWSQRFAAAEWNGFKEKDDVVLTLVPTAQAGTREISRNDGSTGHMATQDLVLRVESIEAKKAS